MAELQPISIQQLVRASGNANALDVFVNADAATMVFRPDADPIESLEYWRDYMGSLAAGKDGESFTFDDLTQAQKEDIRGADGLDGSYTLKAYSTYDLMTADAANISANTSVNVTNDATTSKNGMYVYNGTAFTKSAYDPLTQSKSYIDTAKSDTLTKVQNVFATKALMTASALLDGSSALVNSDTIPSNNGFYKKVTGVWALSSYDVLALAKADATIKASNAISAAANYTDDATANLPIVESLISSKVISRNVYNPINDIYNTYLDASGEPYSITGYKTTQFIPLDPNKSYSSTGGELQIYEYDEDQKFIVQTGYTYPTMNDFNPLTRYIRFKGGNTSIFYLYETNYYQKPDVYKSTGFLDASHVDNLNVSSSELSFTENLQSLNIADPKYTRLNVLISDSGDEAGGSDRFKIIENIPVVPNTAYYKSNHLAYNEMDSNDQFLRGGAGNSILTGADTAYLKIMVDGFNSPASVVKGSYSGSIPFSENIYIEDLVTDKDWLGKTMVWMGTSIPAGSQYPQKVADAFGAKIHNISIGGGRVRAFNDDYTWERQSTLPYLFTLLKSDVQTKFGMNIGLKVKSTNYELLDEAGVELTQTMLDSLTQYNIEVRLLPLIAETDLFVMDYGINDRNGQKDVFPFSSPVLNDYDRNSFAGSMAYLFKTILEAKPTARIIIVGHHGRYNGGSPNSSDVVNSQEEIAKFWGFPFVDVAAIAANNHIVNEGLHPVSGGLVDKRYTKAIVNKIKSIAL